MVEKAGATTNAGNSGSYPIKKAKLPKEVIEFFDGFNKSFDFNRFELSQDKLYYIPDTFPAVRGLRILRCGLYLGEIKKNRFEPSQSLAMSLKYDDFKNVIKLTSEDDRVNKYLKGETIYVDEVGGKNGWALICVDLYPLGWGKLNNGVLKNKYLPGWRLMS